MRFGIIANGRREVFERGTHRSKGKGQRHRSKGKGARSKVQVKCVRRQEMMACRVADPCDDAEHTVRLEIGAASWARRAPLTAAAV